MDSQALGIRIQFYREKASMTQAELAELIGCTPQHIRAIERGVKMPKLETFVAICKALAVPSNLSLCNVAVDLDELWEAEVENAMQMLTPQLRELIGPKLLLNIWELEVHEMVS